ncbi:hypothetical protein [Hymenobacter antarcticus]|uniref:Uncharacterized protein n=1 Tax=Hymenobacter antarcticus TaxID=486270 RepID=A0ABP7PJ73_9BACT
MDTQNPSTTPAEDQPRNAAQPTPNSADTNASSPTYGEFGGVAASAPLAANHTPQPANSTPPGRSGSNDNPDEFSEFRDRKEAEKAPDNPEDQPGHVEQNQDPEAVRAASHADADVQRQAWAQDDPRYAGGGTHNTRSEPAGNPATDE